MNDQYAQLLAGLKAKVKERVGPEGITQLRRLRWRSQALWHRAAHRNDLRAIGEGFGAGKPGWYYPLYQRHLGPLRSRPLRVLEIGIGGYETPVAGGGSLRTWNVFLPRARIFGIDIHDKSAHDMGRIRTFRGSQADEPFLRQVLAEMGHVDVIIDDGSHMNEHVLASFRILFPLLAADGLYVIEDTQTSYWESWGGSARDLASPGTTMGFIKELLDGLNHAEFPAGVRPASQQDRTVAAVHCYHNIVFIEKGSNTDPSSVASSSPSSSS
jgi:hypothetical protein